MVEHACSVIGPYIPQILVRGGQVSIGNLPPRHAVYALGIDPLGEYVSLVSSHPDLPRGDNTHLAIGDLFHIRPAEILNPYAPDRVESEGIEFHVWPFKLHLEDAIVGGRLYVPPPRQYGSLAQRMGKIVWEGNAPRDLVMLI